MHYANQRQRMRRLVKKCLGGKRTLQLNAALKKWMQFVASADANEREQQLLDEMEEMKRTIMDLQDDSLREENENLKSRVAALEESSVVINKLTNLLMSPPLSAAGGNIMSLIGGNSPLPFSPLYTPNNKNSSTINYTPSPFSVERSSPTNFKRIETPKINMQSLWGGDGDILIDDYSDEELLHHSPNRHPGPSVRESEVKFGNLSAVKKNDFR